MAEFDISLVCQFYFPIMISILCNYLIGNLNDPVSGILHIWIIILSSIITNTILNI